MLIDWFTVFAQALNFIILIGLLKHFLYQPILDAIDAREKRIEQTLKDAEAQKVEAKKEHALFQHKNEVFEQQSRLRTNQITDEAKLKSQEIMNTARQNADALILKRQEILKNDVFNLNKTLRHETQQAVFDIVRKILSELTTTTLEQHLTEVFIRRLKEIDTQAKNELSQGLNTKDKPVIVRSAFDLPEEQQQNIQTVFNEVFSTKISIDFIVSPKVISGIELNANGWKIAWNMADYIALLEKKVNTLLNEHTSPQIPPSLPEEAT